jgi:glutamate:GABA antiporter
MVYILATSAILAFIPPSAEDVVALVVQGLSRNVQAFGLNRLVMPPAVVLIFIQYLATFCAFFTVSTRLPMVAGWEHIVAEWFSRLHPRYKTPMNSVVFLGGATLVIAFVSLVGVRPAEAYELLLTWSFTFYGIAYLAMFAIPIFSTKAKGLRPRIWLRVAAGLGLLVTLLSVVLSVFPIIDVGSSWLYSAKIAAVVLGANALGWIVFFKWARKNRTRHPPGRNFMQFEALHWDLPLRPGLRGLTMPVASSES